MKTFKVVVSYIDAQPGEETYELIESYIIEADCEANAEQKAMERCAQKAWSFEPVESKVTEISDAQERAA